MVNRANRSRSRGSTILETLLFTPLAVFILAVVSDAGFAALDFAATLNVVRTASRYTHNNLEGSAPFIQTFDGKLGLNSERIHSGLIAVRQAVVDQLQLNQSRLLRAPFPFFVRVTAIQLSFDRATGEIADSPRLIEFVELQTNNFEQLSPTSIPSPEQVLDTFVARIRAKDSLIQLHRIRTNVSDDDFSTGNQFLPSGIAIGIEVHGISRAVFSSITTILRGHPYEIDLLQFYPWRGSLG